MSHPVYRWLKKHYVPELRERRRLRRAQRHAERWERRADRVRFLLRDVLGFFGGLLWRTRQHVARRIR